MGRESRFSPELRERAEPDAGADPIDTDFGTKRETPAQRASVSADNSVGHEGFEPTANGLRIHCSTRLS